jgi:hypothetical protein
VYNILLPLFHVSFNSDRILSVIIGFCVSPSYPREPKHLSYPPPRPVTKSCTNLNPIPHPLTPLSEAGIDSKSSSAGAIQNYTYPHDSTTNLWTVILLNKRVSVSIVYSLSDIYCCSFQIAKPWQ